MISSFFKNTGKMLEIILALPHLLAVALKNV